MQFKIGSTDGVYFVDSEPSTLIFAPHPVFDSDKEESVIRFRSE